jgi:hypothetical protein
MYKSIVGLLVVAAASAQITFKNPVAALLRRQNLEEQEINSAVKWSACKSNGGFKTDFANTKSNPLEPVKGKNVDLILQGIFTDDADLDAIKVHCNWADTPLYEQEFSRGVHYDSGAVMKDTITWFIPGFAPSGAYQVTLTLHDKGTKKVFGCIQADFSL